MMMVVAIPRSGALVLVRLHLDNPVDAVHDGDENDGPQQSSVNDRRQNESAATKPGTWRAESIVQSACAVVLARLCRSKHRSSFYGLLIELLLQQMNRFQSTLGDVRHILHLMCEWQKSTQQTYERLSPHIFLTYTHSNKPGSAATRALSAVRCAAG